MGMSKKVILPQTEEYFRDGAMHVRNVGMTLRDYFAGQALAGDWVGDWNKSEAAKIAYEIADAMLAARESGNE
jgi:hypothetical protein